MARCSQSSPAMNAKPVTAIRPTAINPQARVESLAQILAALLAKEPELAERLLAAHRAPSGVFEAAPPQNPPELNDPAYEAAERDVEVAKELLAKAIAARSEILKGIQASKGPGPYLTPHGRAQIVSRKSSLGTTFFLRNVQKPA